MAIQIETMPGYEQARARYDGAITAARAQQDAAAETAAELQWSRDQTDLYRQAADQATSQAALDSARATARTQFPNAPEASYAAITDPTAMLAAAQATHEAVLAARGAAGGGVPPGGQPTPGSWPTPPVGGTPVPPRPDNPLDDATTYRETLGRALNGPKSSERTAWESPDRQAIVDYALDRVQSQGLQTVHVSRPHDDQRKRKVEW